MKTVKEIIEQNILSASFEFFPPKTADGSIKLFDSIKDLQALEPSFVSVTYGAGGAGQSLTNDLVLKLSKETDLCVVSHLTCVGQSRQDVLSIVDSMYKEGIRNILALRGDPPKGSSIYQAHPEGFEYTFDLVTELKKIYPELCIGVAGFPEGHPETPNRLKELEYLKRKVDAGADFMITQLFFENRDYYDFCERCEAIGINIPIIAGIMPITSSKGLKRMSELALGARIPAKLMKALSRAEDDEAIKRVGIHWSTQQVLDLVENKVKGIHFYTLNKSHATKEIYKSLGVTKTTSLRSC